MRKLTSYSKVQRLIGHLIRGTPFGVRRKDAKLLNVGCGPHVNRDYLNLDYTWHPEIDICWDIVKKRGRRLPLAYVLGSQPFMGLDIEVTTDVLVPRPETEEVVEEAARLLHSAGKKAPHILEIGTGAGCVSVALAKSFPDAIVFATDISAAALGLALRNAEKHGCAERIRFVQEDLHRPEAGRSGWADLVISNPPYIPSGIVPTLEPEVLNEPRLALDGGPDGLGALRAIIAEAPRHLKPGALLVLEIGFDQGPAGAAPLKARGFKETAVRPDAQGHERIAVGVW